VRGRKKTITRDESRRVRWKNGRTGNLTSAFTREATRGGQREDEKLWDRAEKQRRSKKGEKCSDWPWKHKGVQGQLTVET